MTEIEPEIAADGECPACGDMGPITEDDLARFTGGLYCGICLEDRGVDQPLVIHPRKRGKS